MEHFKIVSTITFEIDSESPESASQQAWRLLDELFIDTKKYDKFNVKMELVPVKVRTPSIVKIREFSPEEVFSWMDEKSKRKEIKLNDQVYTINICSDRYKLFRNSPCCASCGIIGKKFVLECRIGDTHAHLNFYAEENGKDLLMTKDHIKPKSYGGKDELNNFANCCVICNQLKSSFPISYPSVNELRKILRNSNRLPTRELRKLITKTRLTMLEHLDGQ